jgi:NitT/TauT family transport system substrate-binding protein
LDRKVLFFQEDIHNCELIELAIKEYSVTLRLKFHSDFGVLSLVSAGMFLALFSNCSNQVSEPLRFGINPWPGYEFIHLAKVKGFYEKNNVNVQLLDFASLNDNRLGYLRNQIDGMACTQIEMIQLLDQTDRKPVAVFPTDYSNGADMILAADSLVGLKSLLHKRIALEPGTLNIFILSRAMELNGISLDSITLVPFPQTKLPNMWQEKAFDAAVCYPPVSVELEKSGMHKVFTSKEIPREVLDILVFDQTVIDKRPEDIRRFLKAYEDAQAYWLTHRQESDSIMAQHMGVSSKELSDIIENDIHICSIHERKAILAEAGPAMASLSKVHASLGKVGSVSKPLPVGKWIQSGMLP